MKIPRKFQLMGLEWTVVFEPPTSKDGRELFGLTNFACQRITISPNITKVLQEQTFLHELCHAVWWQMSLDHSFSDKKEELVVNSLANGLYAALKELKLIN